MNPDGAVAAGQSNRIDATGAYIGTFTRAEAVMSTKKTEGIEFSFVDKQGREASFLSLWTYSADNKELSGKKMLDAMMVCMRVKSITPSDANVEKWVNGTKGIAAATVFKDLMGKQIGLLLSREPYEAKDGSIKYQFQIEGTFAPMTDGTTRTAKNIIEGKPDDGTVAKMTALLADKPLKRRAGPASGGQAYGGSQPAAGHPASGGDGFAGMDDDIPW
jgi:hypothetical protein